MENVNPPPTNNHPVLLAALRAKAVQELHELEVISAFVDSRLESIERFLNSFANQPNETDMNNLESDDESVDTPLVSPFPHSDNDSDDGEVLNELSEYENVGVLRQERIINSFDRDVLAFQCMIGFRKFTAYLDPFLPMNIISHNAYNTIMVEGLEGTGKEPSCHLLEDIGEFIVSDMTDVVMGKPFRKVTKLEYDCAKGLISFTRIFDNYTFQMPRTIPRKRISHKGQKQSQKRQNQARDGKDKVKSKPKSVKDRKSTQTKSRVNQGCPASWFSELHQLDTFYNALNANDQDSLNSAAGVRATSTPAVFIRCCLRLKDMVRRIDSRIRKTKLQLPLPVKAVDAKDSEFASINQKLNDATRKCDHFPLTIHGSDVLERLAENEYVLCCRTDPPATLIRFPIDPLAIQRRHTPSPSPKPQDIPISRMTFFVFTWPQCTRARSKGD
ncbi:hypothetical protein Tco_1293779 [Tanacetum coccineum]